MVMAGGRWWRRVVRAAVGAVCLYQVLMNYQVLLAGDTWVAVREGGPALLPPLLVCAYPPLDPRRLLPLGLRLNTSGLDAAKLDMDTLAGLPATTPLFRLVQEAGWSLRQLVREVRLGTHRQLFSLDAPSPSGLWELAYYEGPCHQLRPRSAPDHAPINLSFTLQTEHQFQEAAGGRSEAEVARRLLQKLFHVSVYLPASSSEYMMATQELPQRLEKQQQVASYSVRVAGRAAASSGRAATCRLDCYAALAREKGYCFLLPPPPAATLGSSCTLLHSDIESAIECLQQCGSEEHEDKWRTVEVRQTGSQGEAPQVQLEVLGGRRLLWEEEVYPVHKFLADMGGSLGLFLGLSLASLGASVCKLGPRWVQGREGGVGLAQVSLGLLLLFLLTLHSLASLHRLLSQPGRTSVTLQAGAAPSGPPGPPGPPATLRDDLAARLASRSLGCHVPSASSPMVTCLLQDPSIMPLSAAPFLSVQDLPVCRESFLQEQTTTQYVLPLELAAPREVEAAATRCLQGGGVGSGPPPEPCPVRVRVTQEEPLGGLSLLLEMGGIVGLYLGWSVYGGLSRALSGVARGAAAVVLAGAAGGACWLLLQEYFSHHPVSFMVSSSVLDTAAVAVTLCPWPPLNISRLLTVAGHPLESEGGPSPPADRPPTALLEALLRNTSLLEVAWGAAQWRLEEIVDSYFDGVTYRGARVDGRVWRPVASEGRRCFTFTPPSAPSLLVAIIMTHESPALFTLHPAGEPPFPGRAFTSPSMLTKVSSYYGLGQEDAPPLGACYQRCVWAAAAARVACPRTPPTADLMTPFFCDPSLARRALLWAFTPPQESSPLPLEEFTHPKAACVAACRKSPRGLVSLLLMGRGEVTAPSFTLWADAFFLPVSHGLDSRTILHEQDLYPASRLLSEVGCLLGLLLGLSLLTVVNVVMASLTRTHEDPARPTNLSGSHQHPAGVP